jgi:flavin-dependent dehydrogenase
MMYDLIVIGGGPAGSATAIAAARSGANVLLLERGRYPRQKVCGEFVSPEAVALLSALLLPDDGRLLVGSAPKIESMRLFIDGQTISAPVSPSAISISRFELDAALWRACEAVGVNARQDSPVDRVRDANTVVVSGSTVTARALVDATGRWSNLRRERNARRTGPALVGLKAHFAECLAPPSVDVYFFPGGYCGVQPVADGIVNVCALSRAEAAIRLEDVFSLDMRLKRRADSWKPVMDTVTTSPLIFRQPCPVENDILRVGDAAGFIDPFVGDGISLALQTGIAAAKALWPVWQDNIALNAAIADYASEYNKRFLPIFLRANRMRRLVDLPFPLRTIAVRAARLPGVSEKLVKLTRAA